MEPIELEPEEAQAAQKLIGDPAKPKDTPFSIEGVWSGTKGDMKFVVFPKKEEDQYKSKEHIEPMTKQEAEEFEKRYLPFVAQAKAEGYKAPHIVAEALWMESMGAVTLTRWEHPKTGKQVDMAVRPVQYKEAQHIRDRWKAYRAKVEYADKMRTAELERMAAEVGQSKTVKTDLN